MMFDLLSVQTFRCQGSGPLLVMVPRSPTIIEKPEAKPASLFVTRTLMVAGPLPGAITAIHAARHPKFPSALLRHKKDSIKQT